MEREGAGGSPLVCLEDEEFLMCACIQNEVLALFK